jgi:hypothetical protein
MVKCVDMILIEAILAVRPQHWPWVCVLEHGARWVSTLQAHRGRFPGVSICLPAP